MVTLKKINRCKVYNELYVSFARSKKRKRMWAEKIIKHKSECQTCQKREKFVR